MAKSGTPENRGETRILNYRSTRWATVLRIEVTAKDLFCYMSHLGIISSTLNNLASFKKLKKNQQSPNQ